MTKISIVIPIYNEEEYIEECIDSIVGSEKDGIDIEVLLIDGGSVDQTLEKIDKYMKKYKFLKLYHNSKKIAPVAMNIGIKNSRGEYVFVISAHAKYEKNYFKELLLQCKNLNADCVGPVLETKVKNKTKVSNAIKNVLSDRFGVGSAFRSGVDKIKEVDTVAFGCYKKEIFDKIGLYDERLVRNQDIELNKRLIKNGGKIYLIPDVKCTYFARESFKELAKNNFANGRWNILTAYYTKTFGSLSLRHFIPMLFVLGVFTTILFSLIYNFLFYLFLSIFIPYLIIIMIRSYQIKKETTFVYQFLAFIVLHFSYGMGSIVGLFDILKRYFKGKL